MRKVCATLLAGMLLNPGMLGAAPPPPAKNVVIIFQENVSFDHYFGTYPVAANGQGEPRFQAAAGTPTVNGLSNALINNNPNLNPANGGGATNPFRFSRAEAATQDQNHDYLNEQQAFDNGLMDLPNHGVFRRKHGDRILELRATLLHERQLVRDKFWSLDGRSH
jgi:phospholipase C